MGTEAWWDVFEVNVPPATGISLDDKIILVDDVMTYGYSMKDCIYLLENAGAQVLWRIGLAKIFK